MNLHSKYVRIIFAWFNSERCRLGIVVQPLPYDLNALEPFISTQTMEVHYKKHYKGYVNKLNELINNTAYDKLTLEQIILKSAAKSNNETDVKIFNNASQAWNHTFYWNCMSSSHNQMPAKEVDKTLSQHFKSKVDFINEFNSAAMNLFGSGWVWLVKNQNGSLEIFKGKNADNPLVYGKIPILNCDVWEHAYYLDYKNDRKTYLQKFWNLVDWEFVKNCLSKSEEISDKMSSVNVNQMEVKGGTRR